MKQLMLKRLDIIGEQLIFFFEMFPMLQCKEFLCIQGDVFVFYWILFYNNYQYFFIFWPVTNEPWTKICYQKWAMTELKSVTPFNMTGHCQKIILSPGGNNIGHLTIMNEGEYRQITPSEISIILHMIQKPNSIITVLLFIQNNS